MNKEYEEIGLNYFMQIMKLKGKNLDEFNIEENIVYYDKLLDALKGYSFIGNSRKIEVIKKSVELRVKRIKNKHCE